VYRYAIHAMTQRQGADDTNPTRSWALRTRRGHPKSVAILKAPFGGVGNFAQLAGSDFSSSDFFAIRRLHRSRAHLTPTPPSQNLPGSPRNPSSLGFPWALMAGHRTRKASVSSRRTCPRFGTCKTCSRTW
jgi:hypothetical protein